MHNPNQFQFYNNKQIMKLSQYVYNKQIRMSLPLKRRSLSKTETSYQKYNIKYETQVKKYENNQKNNEKIKMRKVRNKSLSAYSILNTEFNKVKQKIQIQSPKRKNNQNDGLRNQNKFLKKQKIPFSDGKNIITFLHMHDQINYNEDIIKKRMEQTLQKQTNRLNYLRNLAYKKKNELKEKVQKSINLQLNRNHLVKSLFESNYKKMYAKMDLNNINDFQLEQQSTKKQKQYVQQGIQTIDTEYNKQKIIIEEKTILQSKQQKNKQINNLVFKQQTQPKSLPVIQQKQKADTLIINQYQNQDSLTSKIKQQTLNVIQNQKFPQKSINLNKSNSKKTQQSNLRYSIQQITLNNTNQNKKGKSKQHAPKPKQQIIDTQNSSIRPIRPIPPKSVSNSIVSSKNQTQLIQTIKLQAVQSHHSKQDILKKIILEKNRMNIIGETIGHGSKQLKGIKNLNWTIPCYFLYKNFYILREKFEVKCKQQTQKQNLQIQFTNAIIQQNKNIKQSLLKMKSTCEKKYASNQNIYKQLSRPLDEDNQNNIKYFVEKYIQQCYNNQYSKLETQKICTHLLQIVNSVLVILQIQNKPVTPLNSQNLQSEETKKNLGAILQKKIQQMRKNL